MDALVSSDGFAVVLEPTLSSLSTAVRIVDIKGANNNNSRYYCLLKETIPGSEVSSFLDAARLEIPTFFFLTALSTISCDEDDDPVTGPAAAAGSLATCSPSIRAIAWHCSRIIRGWTQIDSMVVSISSEGFAAIASEERLGSESRRRNNVNEGEP